MQARRSPEGHLRHTTTIVTSMMRPLYRPRRSAKSMTCSPHALHTKRDGGFLKLTTYSGRSLRIWVWPLTTGREFGGW